MSGGFIPPGVRRELVKILNVGEGEVEAKVLDAVDDLAAMIERFVRAGRYTYADRLAHAASREVVSATLYEALRESRSAYESGRPLDDEVRPYIAKKESVELLLKIIDLDLVTGLEAVKRAAIKAMASGVAKKKKEEEKAESGEKGE